MEADSADPINEEPSMPSMTVINRVSPFDGTHYWVVPVTYRIADPGATLNGDDPVILDRENLATLHAVCCYHCGRFYNGWLTAEPCERN